MRSGTGSSEGSRITSFNEKFNSDNLHKYNYKSKDHNTQHIKQCEHNTKNITEDIL